MNDLEALTEMLELQRSYTEMMFKAHNINGYEDIEEKISLALVDEIGEFNHELKPVWVWWKENPGQVNKDRILDEYADIVHFCLDSMIANGRDNLVVMATVLDGVERSESYDTLPKAIKKCCLTIGLDSNTLEIIAGLRKLLGIEWEDVLYYYKRKNEVNRERVVNHY